MTGIHGDLPALQAHAKAVEAITARVDKAAGAAANGSRNTAAWGVLLYPYGEIFVNGLGNQVSQMISALSETGGVCGKGVEDCRASYEQVEAALTQMFKGIQK
ncbi:hypothetical protein N8J89_38550 [Crossiella sp. CA-258035]|uniref:hypothetical protein n=1 Tax=Crossiella sp. CA-258035 TaxID=2981138 RepID=UPI0024BCAA9A|nr:hypothetical protein [Crossiella sp. CA-258035]WHT18939.1 hypothetical protein N8J89_38550 [Crossiella sp. CA-258035]